MGGNKKRTLLGTFQMPFRCLLAVFQVSFRSLFWVRFWLLWAFRGLLGALQGPFRIFYGSFRAPKLAAFSYLGPIFYGFLRCYLGVFQMLFRCLSVAFQVPIRSLFWVRFFGQVSFQGAFMCLLGTVQGPFRNLLQIFERLRIQNKLQFARIQKFKTTKFKF